VSTYLKLKESLKECETQRSFVLFINAISSEASKKSYTYGLNKFIEFAKLESYDQLASLDTETIQNHLEQFVFHCKKKEHKNIGIKTRLSGPELFLEMNRKVYFKKILHKLLPRDDVPMAGNVPFTNEDIQMMLDATKKLRTKALVHLIASTGIRPGAISDPPLRMKHIVNMPNGCRRVKLYDESREGYWGFLTPEAGTAFQRYINLRKRKGEEINDESYAFVTYNHRTKKSDYFNLGDLSTVIKNLIKSSGIVRKKVGKHYDKAQTYGFRKRFNSIMKLDNQINSNIAEKLMGHSVQIQLDNRYLSIDDPRVIKKCFEEFKKAIPELTVDGTARKQAELNKANEYNTKLQKTNQELRNLKDVLKKELIEELREGFYGKTKK